MFTCRLFDNVPQHGPGEIEKTTLSTRLGIVNLTFVHYYQSLARRPDRYWRLPRDIGLLSLDVFGAALQAVVLATHDQHHLVAMMLADSYPALTDHYVPLRLEAESRARAQAESDQRPEIVVADIADRLGDLVGNQPLCNEPLVAARHAIAIELALQRVIHRVAEPA